MPTSSITKDFTIDKHSSDNVDLFLKACKNRKPHVKKTNVDFSTKHKK